MREQRSGQLTFLLFLLFFSEHLIPKGLFFVSRRACGKKFCVKKPRASSMMKECRMGLTASGTTEEEGGETPFPELSYRANT